MRIFSLHLSQSCQGKKGTPRRREHFVAHSYGLGATEQLQDFITSGLTDEDHQRFVNLPGGPEFFAYLSSLSEPLRLAEVRYQVISSGPDYKNLTIPPLRVTIKNIDPD